MPEGHSIHRLSRAFDELFGGTPLAASSPQGRFAAGAALLDGLPLTAAEAYGKQLFLGFGGTPTGPERWLRVHLGLYGAWTFTGTDSFAGPHAIGAPRRRIGEADTAVAGDTGSVDDDGRFVPPAPRGAVRLRLVGRDGCADLTGPSACEVVTGPEKREVIAKLGPDPLRKDTGAAAEFAARIRARRVAAGALLMDQTVAAGVGNIFRAESLFLCGVNPYRPGRDVTDGEARELWTTLARLMRRGVRTGTINSTGRKTVPFFVYHRAGEPCLRCGTPVREALMQARRLFWCPGCQP
ncbi:Fpg/Nei family DNA glycosylase [Spelaeicoccus albus]|uniref:DNA-(apurinic or apyrimidinic site) lyase n=1 Tax=Spelaeicoccus albus TaxID=1280376 RepID=A0A7Z0D4Q8_9MICO|nr:DNA glycosylase [Spelaeicoccus albus]NYI68849.1 formamidopyrimidine-DNA glycosylase [Spelaeicoccus albus]